MRPTTITMLMATIALTGAVAVSAFGGFGDWSKAEDFGEFGASLDAVRQVEADRLTALAEYHSLASVREARAAEAARWQAIGEQYRGDRARQSEVDRLKGMAEQFGLAGLPRGQQAEADRLTRLAEYQGAALCGRVCQLRGAGILSHGRP